MRAKGTAENALGLFSTEVIEENDKVNLQRIEESIIVGEIKELKRFWPQFGVNLAAGSALSQRKAPAKVTSKSAATAASKVLRKPVSSKSAKTAAGSALTQKPNKKK